MEPKKKFPSQCNDRGTVKPQDKVLIYNSDTGASDEFSTVAALTKIQDDNINLKVDKGSIKQVISESTTDIPSLGAVKSVIDLKVDKDSVVQGVGTSTTGIMSQNAVTTELGKKVDTTTMTTELDKKVDKTAVKQTTGASTTDVMSQKATTDELSLKVDKVAGQRLLTTEEATKLSNTSGTNTGDNATNSLYSGLDAAKVDKEAGKSLISDTEISRLASVTNQTLSGLGGEPAANKKTSITDSDVDFPTGKAVKTALDLKVDKSSVKQTKGASTTDVMSQNAVTTDINRIDALVANIMTNWVGVVIDPTMSSSEPAPKSTVVAYRATELMRTGNLHFHKYGQSRIFNAFQMAIVNRDTRKVAWYLDKADPTLRADKTLSTPDWTTQNIAVIVPNLWRRVTVLDVVTGKYEVAYDIEPFAGAQLWHEESAHSPGFASVDRTLTQLVSVVSDDVRFRGGGNQSAWDTLPSTQLGRPATNLNRVNFENYAASAGWETGNIADRTLWHELTALYFANTNIQLNYTDTLTAEGYPQGGLGAGVTTWSSSRWNILNGYNPIHKVGEGFMAIGCNVGVKAVINDKYYIGAITSVSAGNLVATGSFTVGAGWSASYVGYTVQNLNTLAEATITAKTDDNTLALSTDIFTEAEHWYWIKGVSLSYEIPVFFGLENLYGDLWDWVSGVNVDVSATVENGGTGESKAYVCTDFTKRASTITADYKLLGLVPRIDGYIKSLYRDFVIAKSNTGASSTSYLSDQAYYGNLPESGNVIRGLLFGANAGAGVLAGVRCSYANNVPATATANFGARLRAKIER